MAAFSPPPLGQTTVPPNYQTALLPVIAAELGLSIHDKPASPCLSSRIPYGEPVTPEKLQRIDAAETFLRELGFRECRVRHHEQLARIEVPTNELPRFGDAELRARIDARLQHDGHEPREGNLAHSAPGRGQQHEEADSHRGGEQGDPREERDYESEAAGEEEE